MKKFNRIFAFLMAAIMVFAMAVPVAAEEQTEDTTYVSLSDISQLKAGQTATVSVTVNKEVYMNAYEFLISFDTDKVEFATAPNKYGQYSVYTRDFTYSGGSRVGNYSAEENELVLTGSNTSIEDALVKAGTVIAKFDIKAKTDLSVGDVVATLKNSFITDIDEKSYVENETENCVVMAVPAPAKTYIALGDITNLKVGEVATVNVLMNKEVIMSAYEINIKLDSSKVELATVPNKYGQYKFYTNDFIYAGGSKLGSYDAENQMIILSGANTSAVDSAVAAGTVIATFKVKAKVDLSLYDVVATQTTSFIHDDIAGADLAENETESSVVAETITVKLNLRGGEGEENVKIVPGQTISEIPRPDRKEFIFAGWYGEDGCENPLDPDAEVTANANLYAKWQMKGDIDQGDNVDANDALFLLKVSAGIIDKNSLNDLQKLAGNVVGDEMKLDANDALAVLKRVANMISGFDE